MNSGHRFNNEGAGVKGQKRVRVISWTQMTWKAGVNSRAFVIDLAFLVEVLVRSRQTVLASGDRARGHRALRA